MALSNNDDLRDAHYLFGILYEKGLSVEVSQKTAFECFKKAASLQHAYAHTKLGHCYYSGIKEQLKDSFDLMSQETEASMMDEPQYIVQPDRKLAL